MFSVVPLKAEPDTHGLMHVRVNTVVFLLSLFWFQVTNTVMLNFTIFLMQGYVTLE